MSLLKQYIYIYIGDVAEDRVKIRSETKLGMGWRRRDRGWGIEEREPTYLTFEQDNIQNLNHPDTLKLLLKKTKQKQQKPLLYFIRSLHIMSQIILPFRASLIESDINI